MRVQDIVEMNSHDKQTIYEAYSVEAAARKQLNKELNEERKHTAALRFDAQYWQDAWLEDKIRNEVAVEGSMDEAIDYYFGHSKRHLFMTEDNGFYALVDEGDHIFIMFAWTNPDAWSRERKNMVKLVRQIYDFGLPVRYTGVSNIMRRHSVEIEPGLYELKF